MTSKLVNAHRSERVPCAYLDLDRLPQYKNTTTTALVKSQDGVQDQWLSAYLRCLTIWSKSLTGDLIQ